MEIRVRGLRGVALVATVATISGVLLLAGGASAHDERWVVPGSLYAGGGVGAEYFNLSETKGIVSPGGTLGSTDGSFWSESAHAVIGFADGEGLTLPDPVGRNARIELRGRWTRGDSDDTRTRSVAFARIHAVDDPTLTSGLVGGGGGTFTAIGIHETRLRTWQADLLYLTDVEIVDPIVVTPFVGLTYTRWDLENNIIFDALNVFPPGITGDGFRDTQDDLEADYYGVALGADFRARPASWLELRLGGRADLMGVDADLDAKQNLVTFPMGLGSPVVLHPTESDGDADFAARVTGSVGIGFQVGIVELALDGFARWLSYAPIADHPIRTNDQSSRIQDTDAWSAGWMASVKIWLP